MVHIYLITGDIGGTNSRMSLYETGSYSTALVEKWYRNQEHLTDKTKGGFERQILLPFLRYCWDILKVPSIDNVEFIACLACAGPVQRNKVVMSNLGIEISGSAIEANKYSKNPFIQKIKRVKIINDFVAQGYGCLTLAPHEVKELTPGSHGLVDNSGPKVCVGAGTGLGECYLTPNEDESYSCFASEGGHVEFNPRSEVEIKLRAYLQNKFNSTTRVSIERVVSGIGLANVYEFLAKEFPRKVDKSVHDQFLAAGDEKGRIVSDNSKSGTLCKQALDIMISAYGAEAGSCAVKWIPTGGLYITGGITPKNIQHIEGQDSAFMKAYRDKGRVSSVLSNIPVFAVMVEDLGVRGVHHACLEEYKKMTKETTNTNKKSFAVSSYAVPAIAAAVAVGAGVLIKNARG
mmetsp:Transcript_29701/g.45015  ORF Transcript_29701/g.45015 Transcript_29701/m.45015 type:complete len:404 (+) Transcript_29701:164-1375(+)